MKLSFLMFIFKGMAPRSLRNTFLGCKYSKKREMRCLESGRSLSKIHQTERNFKAIMITILIRTSELVFPKPYQIIISLDITI